MAEVMSTPASYSSGGLRRSRPSQPNLLLAQQQPSSSSSSRKSDKRSSAKGGLSVKNRSLSSPSKLNTLGLSGKSSDGSKSHKSSKPKVKSPPPPPVKDNTVSLVHKFDPLPPNIDDNNDEENDAPPSSPSPQDDPPRSVSLPARTKHNLKPFQSEDDSAVKTEPKRHVDYLSHEWKEEDIWCSWRLIVSQRKIYGEKSRLENASWRSWAKSKNNLKTVHPKQLNWLKDYDLTWLYGPLKTPENYILSPNTAETSNSLTHTNSFLNKKPILKKRSMSELMLQKSLSTSSLVRQAAAAAQAQRQRPYDSFARRPSDFLTDTSHSTTSREGTEYFSSQSTSGFHSPSPNEGEPESDRKHIRFDNKVEQCQAIDIRDDGDYDADFGKEYDSSDDGVVMMKRVSRKPSRPQPSRRTSTTDSILIKKLSDTTLKDRIDSSNHQQPSHSLDAVVAWKPKLPQSPSVETLRPKNPAKNFLLDEDEEDDDDDTPAGPWHIRYQNPEDVPQDERGMGPEFVEQERDGGLRRTESGMFMPVGDEDDPATGGLIGRVLDTVNTARDIAHVIWNVGWTR